MSSLGKDRLVWVVVGGLWECVCVCVSWRWDGSYCLEKTKGVVTSLMSPPPPKNNSRLPLCATVAAWKGDHMSGWRGLLCPAVAAASSHRRHVSSRSASSKPPRCKTIKLLLTYILLIALSGRGRRRHAKCPGLTDPALAWRGSVLTESDSWRNQVRLSTECGQVRTHICFAIDSSNQFN